MAVTGAIADAARQQMPTTWDGLSKDERFGDDGLRSAVDLVKARLFESPVDYDDEASTYHPIVIDYAGKLTAIQLCPPGADWWSRQPITKNQGPREIIGFVDPVSAIWELHRRLVAEAKDMLAEVEEILGDDLRVRAVRSRVGVRQPDDGDLVTQNPNQFGRTYAPS